MINPVSWLSAENKIVCGSGAHNLIPGKLRLIDQTKLPGTLSYVETDRLEVIFDAIKRLVVRGAPAIGCAASLGLAAVMQHSTAQSHQDFLNELKEKSDILAQSRPTAVNLFWAVE